MHMCLHILMLTMPSQANHKHTDIYSAQDETFIFTLMQLERSNSDAPQKL